MKLPQFFLIFYALGFSIPSLGQDTLQLSSIETDSLFQSKQQIHLLSIPVNDYIIDIGYCDSLQPTSFIAKKHNAIAAINGSYFDMENGGSVTYFEKNDSVISKTPKENKLINGIIILSKNKQLKIEEFKTDAYYQKSQNEQFALVAGPILLKDSTTTELPDKKFTTNRHPRTCVCLKKDAVLFIVIDGRKEEANGMSLFEVQEFLLNQGCIDAINLDGGGSSTMWLKSKGLINTPSSDYEREVANCLLLFGEEK